MKRTFILTLIMTMVLVISMQANAALSNRGTDSLGNRLIYDSDLDITWYDYSNAFNTWQNQMNWASGLSVTGGNLVGVYDDWRLPTADASCGINYNCTNSEMGHLYYTGLSNSAGGPLSNTGDFLNLQPNGYWSGTQYAANTLNAWSFYTHLGYQTISSKNSPPYLYALAVRPGDVSVVPEPVSSILFVVGGVSLGIRRGWKKRSSA